MTTTQTDTAQNIARTYAKWQRAVEKYANPLITPTTAKKYLRDAEKAKAKYLAAKATA